ncbi:hypothetical protein B0H14DRAFT_1479582 [Mycena olivaceomarginata]|nr:hypothetical protein B0H14DRAFT_1479582 [Mycena olivaceomarginata]
MATAADETAALKQSITDMSKTLALLTAEIAKRPATTALEHLLGAAANPLALPPSSNGTYPALNTLTLHPHLLPDVVGQIGKFEFPPTHLGRLLKAFSAPLQGLHLVAGPDGTALFMPPAPVAGASSLLREVPDILAFVEAWMIFTSVLQNTHLELPVAQALTAHLGNIVVLSRAYPWSTILDYHVAFMQARAQDTCFNPVLWMRSEPHLHTTHLVVPHFLPASSSSTAGPSADRLRMAAQVCYMYNTSAGCPGPPNCYRRHVCKNCAGPHSKEMCRPTGGAAPSA